MRVLKAKKKRIGGISRSSIETSKKSKQRAISSRDVEDDLQEEATPVKQSADKEELAPT